MNNYLVQLETECGFCYINMDADTQEEAEAKATVFSQRCGDVVLSAFAVRR